jgi:hypothetical protein
MNMNPITRFPRQSLLVAGIAASLFLAYGAGSSAGIQGSGRRAVLAFGRITAFGSIYVDGVEYGISQAQIKLDGKSAKASQLQVGQVVAVQGVLTDSNSGTANSVSYTGDVVGPASQVDVTGAAFTVLGQRVKVDATTLFGEGIQPAGIAGIQQGVTLEVSGFSDAAGNVLASRIDLVAGAPLQVKGTVQTLNTAEQSFRINDLTIDYSGVVPNGKLGDGKTATVQAVESPANGTLHATVLQVSSGVGGAANEQGQTEGLITSISSNSQFFVGDQEIATNSATNFVLHGQALGPDLPVTVSGTFDASGTLVAKSVKAQPPGAH